MYRNRRSGENGLSPPEDATSAARSDAPADRAGIPADVDQAPTPAELTQLVLANSDHACPSCGYGLRGVQAAECPECAFTLRVCLAQPSSLLLSPWAPLALFLWVTFAGSMNLYREVVSLRMRAGIFNNPFALRAGTAPAPAPRLWDVASNEDLGRMTLWGGLFIAGLAGTLITVMLWTPADRVRHRRLEAFAGRLALLSFGAYFTYHVYNFIVDVLFA